MKKKVILIASFIIVLLSGLIILYNKIPHYNMEVDGVKLAVTLDGNEVSSFPKDNDYYVNITCSHVIGEYLYDETEQTFKLTFKNIESGAKCSLAFTSNPDTLIDIVEANGYFEDDIPSGYESLSQSDYTMTTPFYTSSLSTSVTSGTEEAGAISWDSTNNYWVTNPSVASSHYYYLITVPDAGYYKLCYKQLSGGTTNRLYRYKNTTNMYSSSYVTASSTTDVCLAYGYVETTDTIRIDQYTYGSVASLALYLKKSNSTTNAGYRYEGEDPNNYVWFNNELWRIIGSIPTKIDSGGSTTTTNLVKIIRNESIGGLVWNKTTPRPDWNTSTLYTLLNTYYYGAQNATGNTYCYGYQSTAKAKCDYRDIGIKPTSYYGSMVKEVYWNTGASDYNYNPNIIYGDEISIQTMTGHVGIMNISDYGFAASYNRPTRTKLESYDNTNYTGSDWLYGQAFEWTLIPYPTSTVSVIIVLTYGDAHDTSVTNGCVVRPVVYLDSSAYVVSGDGSRLTPYKLACPSGS